MMRFLLMCVSLLGVAGTPALVSAAQQTQAEPPKPLFAREPETVKPLSVVATSFSAGSGGSAEEPGLTTPLFRYRSEIQASFSHRRETPRKVLSFNLGSSGRYYPQTRQSQMLDQVAGMGLDSRLGAKTRFRFSQTFQSTPFRQFGAVLNAGDVPGLGTVPPSNVDTASAVGPSTYDFGTTSEIARTFGANTGLSLAYASRVSLHSGNEQGRLITQRLGINFRQGIGPYAAVVFGTAARFGESGLPGVAKPTTTQDFDLGVDYNRPFTFARGTTLTFKTGMTIVSQPSTMVPGSSATGKRFLATGALAAKRTLGRNWDAQLGYDKSLQFIDGLPDPFYADGVMARLGGRHGRRSSVELLATYSRGNALDVGPDGLDQSFRGLQTKARFGYALSRSWQFYVQHHYSENFLSVGAMLQLPPGVIPRRFGRGVQVGFNLWGSRVH